MLDTTCCPECGALAEIQWRSVLEGTEGPVEHAKVLCAARHWFLLPVSSLGPRAVVVDRSGAEDRSGADNDFIPADGFTMK